MSVDRERCFSRLTFGRGSRWIYRWCRIAPFMDLELYMEKRLSYSAGMELDLGELTAKLRYWTKAALVDDQEISVGAGI